MLRRILSKYVLEMLGLVIILFWQFYFCLLILILIESRVQTSILAVVDLFFLEMDMILDITSNTAFVCFLYPFFLFPV